VVLGEMECALERRLANQEIIHKKLASHIDDDDLRR
jgi:hypothetical protein